MLNIKKLIKNVTYYLDEHWEIIADPRVKNWPLVSGGIWRVLMITFTYLIITRLILPRFMQNRKSYEIKSILLIYNTMMVIVNGILFYYVCRSINYGRIFFNFEYPSVDDASDKTKINLSIAWYFMVTRYLDLADTVFFVLRKKHSQITFLHSYHHAIVPILCWVSFKYNGMIPIIWMFLLLNTLIHALMYGYYALSALGQRVRRFLWWKKYLTALQVIQFIICGLYGVVLYAKQSNYPMDWFYLCVGQNPLFFYMFFNFYKQNYGKCNQKTD